VPLSYQHSPLGRWTQGHGTPDSPGIGAGRGTPDGNRGRGSPSPSRICQPVPGKSGTGTGESPRFRTNRESVAWSGRPACPTAIPIARAGTRVASLYWEVKDGCRQLCWATRVGTPSPAARPCRRHRRTDSAGSGRPACPTAIPIARAGTRVASLYWEVKDGCGQLCWATRVGTPSPAARPCRRHRRTDSAGSGRPACPTAIPIARS
jgi:hypothetical protein